MRIVFLCGSLEEGKDGVGDYTRKIAIKLIKNGHQVIAISLHDTFTETLKLYIQEEGEYDLPVLRIPYRMDAERRFKETKRYLEVFNPERVSLQYVPFSFQKKGMPFGLSKRLKALGNDFGWHVMFHELWVGMQKGASFKMLIWGYIQRILIKDLLNNLDPLVIHTQTRLYQQQLQNLGFTAKYLPLFANISRSSGDKAANPVLRKKEISLVFFGSIFPGSRALDFTKEVAAFQLKTGIIVSLKFIGRCGTEQAYWFELWKRAGLKVEIIGELPEESISYELRNADIGLSTTPVYLVEKSGAVAAMWLHDLPVISVASPWYPHLKTEQVFPKGIIEYKTGNIEQCLRIKWENFPVYNSEDVAMQMLHDLGVRKETVITPETVKIQN